MSVPQNDRALQTRAIASLCNYANMCSRMIPLVRNAAAWVEIYGKRAPGSDTLPNGTLSTCELAALGGRRARAPAARA